MLTAQSVIPASDVIAAADAQTITLDRESRYRRRIAMTTDQGRAFLLDLPEPTYLNEGDALDLSDGSLVLVRAAANRSWKSMRPIRSPSPHRLASGQPPHAGRDHAGRDLHPARPCAGRDAGGPGRACPSCVAPLRSGGRRLMATRARSVRGIIMATATTITIMATAMTDALPAISPELMGLAVAVLSGRCLRLQPRA